MSDHNEQFNNIYRIKLIYLTKNISFSSNESHQNKSLTRHRLSYSGTRHCLGDYYWI